MSNNGHSASNTGQTQARNGRTIQFRIKRCEGPGKGERWETFKVTTEPGMNVISALQQIAANPVTVEGKQTTPVVWDSGCLEEVCGACTMVINGKVRQSCSCLVDAYAPNEGDTITLDANHVVIHGAEDVKATAETLLQLKSTGGDVVIRGGPMVKINT